MERTWNGIERSKNGMERSWNGIERTWNDMGYFWNAAKNHLFIGLDETFHSVSQNSL